MPYALFSNNEQISKAYKTEQEVWKQADEAGLVVDVASDEETQNPKRVLDEDYCIRPCEADDEHHAPEALDDNIHRLPARPTRRIGKQASRRALTAAKS